MPESMLTNLVVIGGLIGGGLFVLLTVLMAISRFYRRCGADEALVRTGAGGNKVVIGGGIMVYPILHQLMQVSLHSVKLSVERSGKNALVTADKIKANVTTELYIKVEPVAEDVLAAARSFGERNLDQHAIGDLIEGKLTDALRSVAANQTFMSLHGKRKEFAEHIQAALAEELKKNGLTLENVSITGFAMVPVTELDEHDVFDAEGLRAITESVQTNREKTNQIQREKENLIQAQNVEARMRQLQLEQQQKQAEADQNRKVSEYGALQAAETARAVFAQDEVRELAGYEKQKAIENARIAQEQSIAVSQAGKIRAEREAQIEAEKGQQAAEIAKQRTIEAAQIEKEKIVQAAEIDRQKALETATIDKQKAVEAATVAKDQTIEVARIGKVIAVTQSEEQQARAAAAKALALAEEEQATQAITTVETTAKAEREKLMAVIRAQAEAEVKRALAEGEASQAKALAQARLAEAEGRLAVAHRDSEAAVHQAQAILRKGEAEAEARRRILDAENAVSSKLIMRDVALKGIEVLPDVVRELMAPAKAITEIKVLQTNSGGAAGPGAAFGVMSPILKTVLDAGAAYPLFRELMQFAHPDGQTLSTKATTVLHDLAGEINKAMQSDGVVATDVEITSVDHQAGDLSRGP